VLAILHLPSYLEMIGDLPIVHFLHPHSEAECFQENAKWRVNLCVQRMAFGKPLDYKRAF
jgi:hypothetical protein